MEDKKIKYAAAMIAIQALLLCVTLSYTNSCRNKLARDGVSIDSMLADTDTHKSIPAAQYACAFK